MSKVMNLHDSFLTAIGPKLASCAAQPMDVCGRQWAYKVQKTPV